MPGLTPTKRTRRSHEITSGTVNTKRSADLKPIGPGCVARGRPPVADRMVDVHDAVHTGDDARRRQHLSPKVDLTLEPADAFVDEDLDLPRWQQQQHPNRSRGHRPAQDRAASRSSISERRTTAWLRSSSRAPYRSVSGP